MTTEDRLHQAILRLDQAVAQISQVASTCSPGMTTTLIGLIPAIDECIAQIRAAQAVDREERAENP